MVSFKQVLLFAVSATALVIERDVNTIISDLKNVDQKTNALTSQVNSWDGSTLGAYPITTAENNLEKAITAATNDAKNEAPATSADSTTVLNYINNTLEPDIRKSISALEARKSDFDSAGLSDQVRSDLNDLKSKSDNLGAALKAIASSDTQAAAQKAQNKIDADFNGAIAYFAN